MMIQSATYRQIRIPLRQPYVLSFTTVRDILCQQFWIQLQDGRVGAGEAVALTGYSEDTEASIESALKQLETRLPRQTCTDARETILSFHEQSPFACSAACTALELATGEVTLPDSLDVPLLAATSSDAPDLQAVVEKWIAEGFETIKVKIGRELQADIQAVKMLSERFAGRAVFRFDANQAYDLDAARRFCDAVAQSTSQAVELLEQPFGIDAWEETVALTSQTPVAIMLDESIFTQADIDRAVEVGAKLVKLKLFKHAGVTEVLQLARHAQQRGLGVILGNGVSGDVGNLAEGIAYQLGKNMFVGASEGNGFAKLQFQTLQSPPVLEKGRLIWRNLSPAHALVPASTGM